MADVFISYAREDRPQADMIARGLQAIGLECFWDTEIPPGQTWADYIEGKLAACKAVIVVWSANSVGSQWVREEARMGRDKGKLVPVVLGGAAPPFGFGEVQAADLSAWRGDASFPEWSRLANAVHTIVRGAPAPAPQAQPRFAAAPMAPPAGATAQMSPFGYVWKCLRHFADGSGRARRSELAWFVVFAFLALCIAIMLDIETFGVNPYTGEVNTYMFAGLAYLALVIPLTSAASRRAHDFGQSGWLAVLAAIPSFGLLPAVIFACVPGQRGLNQYGADPKGV